MSQSANLPESVDPRVERDKVDLLVKGFSTAIYSTISGPLITAWLFEPYIGRLLAWGPPMLIYALLAERMLMLRRFSQARRAPDYNPAGWGAAVGWRLGLMSAVLGLWMVANIATGNETAMFYALALIALLCAGALTQFCIYPQALWVFVSPLMLGVVAQLVWAGSRNALVSAVYLFVLWATLILASMRFAKVMHSDIAQRYRNEALLIELSAQKEKAEAASEAKSRFLAAASHDLRQPVHAVALLAGALQQREGDAQQSALLQRLQGGVAHFADVVDEVLDVARLDAGAVPVTMQSVRVQDLLDRIDSTYRALAHAKGLALLIRPPAIKNAAIYVDPALTWRVLSNFVGNAVRYTTQGSVLVAVRRHHWTGEVGTANTGREAGEPAGWRIEVRDSGPGIEPSQQSLIFEEFFQLHNPQRDSSKGLGLGLAVARRMADLMERPIGLRSAVGRGTTFFIASPAHLTLALGTSSPQTVAADALPSSLAGSQQVRAAQLRSLRVLVVDDDEAARQAILALLLSWGLTAELASTAEQACAIVRSGYLPHVLLTDHWLAPPDNALTVAHEVLQAVQALQPGTPPPMVAVFTGDMSPHFQQTVNDRGWHFAPKPVRPLALLMWLEICAAQSTASVASHEPLATSH